MAKTRLGGRPLGRGLDALLGVPSEAPETPAPAAREPAADSKVAVELIARSPYQPRRHFEPDALAELTESIRTHGVLQPIVVRRVERDDGTRYELVAGERRWRAAQAAELREVPVVVRELDDQQALAIALVENLQREDLNPVEEAVALRRLADEFDLTHEAVAQAVGRSRTAVTNLLRLLALEAPVRDMLAAGQLEMGHARALLGLDGDQQVAVAREVVAGGLNVRDTERRVRKARTGGPDKTPPPKRDADVARLETRVAEHLGTRVDFSGSGKKGRFVVHYESLEQLQGILEQLGLPDGES